MFLFLCLVGGVVCVVDVILCLFKFVEFVLVFGYMFVEGYWDCDLFGVFMCVYYMKSENGY